MHLGAEVHLLAGPAPRPAGPGAGRPRGRGALCHAGTIARADAAAACPAPGAGRRVKAGPGPCARIWRSWPPRRKYREFYGAAEASFITLADADTPAGSVGRPYPGVELGTCGGEVWVRSPYLFAAMPASPAARWQDGWLSVGEMGRIEDGFPVPVRPPGRMVTVADQNVFPEEIEALMETLPGVVRAAVLAGRTRAGPCAACRCDGRSGGGRRGPGRLRAALGPLKAPRRIAWRGDWPVTAGGQDRPCRAGARGMTARLIAAPAAPRWCRAAAPLRRCGSRIWPHPSSRRCWPMPGWRRGGGRGDLGRMRWGRAAIRRGGWRWRRACPSGWRG
jgi:long-chain acyl-CoA synthetase